MVTSLGIPSEFTKVGSVIIFISTAIECGVITIATFFIYIKEIS
jgi:hypothetical protein